MFDSLTELVSDSATAYLVIAVFVALDAVIPLIPGEVLVTTGGVLAANGELSVALVVAAAVVGAAIGDNVAYWLGANVGRPIAPRLFRNEKSRDRLRWAQTQLGVRGSVIIPVARFIPGGRTATTFAAGTLAFAWRLFVRIDLLAAALWGVLVTALGYFSGETFEERLWQPLLAAAVVALIVALLGELYRRHTEQASQE